MVIFHSFLYVYQGVCGFRCTQFSDKPIQASNKLQEMSELSPSKRWETPVPHVPRILSSPFWMGRKAFKPHMSCQAPFRLPNSHQMAHIVQKHLATEYVISIITLWSFNIAMV